MIVCQGMIVWIKLWMIVCQVCLFLNLSKLQSGHDIGTLPASSTNFITVNKTKPSEWTNSCKIWIISCKITEIKRLQGTRRFQKNLKTAWEKA